MVFQNTIFDEKVALAQQMVVAQQLPSLSTAAVLYNTRNFLYTNFLYTTPVYNHTCYTRHIPGM